MLWGLDKIRRSPFTSRTNSRCRGICYKTNHFSLQFTCRQKLTANRVDPIRLIGAQQGGMVADCQVHQRVHGRQVFSPWAWAHLNSS